MANFITHTPQMKLRRQTGHGLRKIALCLIASLQLWGCASGADSSLLSHTIRVSEVNTSSPGLDVPTRLSQIRANAANFPSGECQKQSDWVVVIRGRQDLHESDKDQPGSQGGDFLAQGPPPSPAGAAVIDVPREGKPQLPAKPLGGILVRVNGEPLLEQEVRSITRWMIEDYISRVQLASLQGDTERKAIESEVSRYLPEVVQQLIDRELLYQEAEKRVPPRGMELVRKAAQQEIDKQLCRRRQQLGFRTEDELREYLERQGISLEALRRQVERNLIADEYLRTLIRPKLEQIDRRQVWDYYQRNLQKFERPERVEWQYIFISAREGARHLRPGEMPDPAKARAHAEFVYGLVKQAKTPQEFARIAEQFSDGPSRSGDGEGSDLASIRPAEIAELVWKTSPGQVGPLVRAGDGRGYHIFRVNKHEPARLIPFEEACIEIRRELQNQIFLAERARILRELRSKAHIEYSSSFKPPR